LSAIRVLLHGATGRMGQEALKAVSGDPDMKPVGGVSRNPKSNLLELPDRSGAIPLSSDLTGLLSTTQPNLVVDFSNAEACISAFHATMRAGIPFVTGTSGLTEDDLTCIDRTAREVGVGVIVAPNFALGAVLLMSLAKKAAPFFDYVDIIEAHHEEKIDAPSGTALALARSVAQGRDFVHKDPQRETLRGSSGARYRGVGIHSLRQPGRSAHHEVIFGAQGQTLSLRHDSLSRDCYMPGVLRAIREVVNLKGLVLGLDKILGV
jgi:4-hydroxy-tetrahydrodipicolinate reductase